MNPTITLTATFTKDEKPQAFTARGPKRDTGEAAAADLDYFPKSAGFVIRETTTGPGTGYFRIVTSANLVANGVNGGVNETGVKRYRTVVRNAECLGIVWQGEEYVYANSYLTREAFEAAL